ncbi:hypothetical protein OSJ77_07380 [Phyllobacterium sp. 0TCS1.6C]|jgi:hypothetical protein|uniref:hypothetical protein n=1 Tax=unclassified Phyllobacterium TaxID=2638441 RepID=UPI00226565C6|nr:MULTISPECIES: hypothetical protein [unclassified Phyllobacterium]MCX8280005.1 hypothetical protein [Phyllobacterium sp. 0TCS1.6C]MCX8296172.1 hypothetical protein [Phyllobacterium sp. 0TCS1.6A]
MSTITEEAGTGRLSDGDGEIEVSYRIERGGDVMKADIVGTLVAVDASDLRKLDNASDASLTLEDGTTLKVSLVGTGVSGPMKFICHPS